MPDKGLKLSNSVSSNGIVPEPRVKMGSETLSLGSACEEAELVNRNKLRQEIHTWLSAQSQSIIERIRWRFKCKKFKREADYGRKEKGDAPGSYLPDSGPHPFFHSFQQGPSGKTFHSVHDLSFSLSPDFFYLVPVFIIL